jgi:hypothetical protein
VIRSTDIPSLKRAMCAGRGHRLESTVIASQGGVILVDKMPTGGRFHRGAPQLIKGPVDYVGEVCGSGRAIMFDAKECALQNRFPVGDRNLVKEHQRLFLIRHGGAGAIAGLLVEATHTEVAAFYWLDWRELLKNEASIQWDDPRMTRLGSSKFSINFRMVPGVTITRE